MTARQPVMPGGEDRLVAWLRRSAPGGWRIGDDAAILDPGTWAVTVDTQIAGVHFPRGLDPALIARRLLAVNLSDLAAMGAIPRFAFLALSTPAGFDHHRFFRAFNHSAKKHGVELAGGDLSRQSTTTTALTLLGSRHPDGRWLCRDDARPGDVLWLGGSVGEAALGLALLDAGADFDGRRIRLPESLVTLSRRQRAGARRAVRRQLQPVAQLALGDWLAKETDRGAAIDISDGLARDLHRLCRSSRVGAEIDRESLPRPQDLERTTHLLDRQADELALYGGEDYVLLFTLPAGCSPPRIFGCTAIGRIRTNRSVSIIDGEKRAPLPDRGWDHFARADD